jgi:hypothetical protein
MLTMPTSVAFMIFMAILMTAGDLRAAARKFGRSAGKGKGKGKAKPKAPAESGKGAQSGEVRPAADPEGEAADGPAPEDRKGTGEAGGRDVRDEDGGRDKTAELTEPPAWRLTFDSEFLNKMTYLANGGGPHASPVGWHISRFSELLRGLAQASLGPDDPRPWAALSRAAFGVMQEPECAEEAAALAAGAVEGLDRAAAVAAGHGKPVDGGALAAETEFAREVLEASRRAAGRLPGRDPGLPFPAPAYHIGAGLYPGLHIRAPVSPCADDLRIELAEADQEGAGSAKALELRSRLGEALADEEAWARARVTTLAPGRPGTSGASGASGTSGDSGDSGASPDSSGTPGVTGERSAEGLLRSASEGLDALLGRTHPDSLSARERLARFLAGGSGPGVPPLPLACELPPAGDLREAEEAFLETSRAWSGTGRPAAPPQAGASPKRHAAPRNAAAAASLPSSGDFRSFAAAGLAAGCALLAGTSPERGRLYPETGRAAEKALGEDNQLMPEFMTFEAERLRLAGDLRGSEKKLMKAAFLLRLHRGAHAREIHGPFLRHALATLRNGDPLCAMESCCSALASMEETDRGGAVPAPGSAPAPWDAAAVPGLPPGRPGRDRLAARILMAECVLAANGPLTASRVLAPLTDALPDLPPSADGPGTWPWPSELAGRALCVAGKAASRLGQGPGAAALLRRALDTLGPEPDDPRYLEDALALLQTELERLGDAESLREAAGLAEREAGILLAREGPDSARAIAALFLAARRRGRAGDTDAALELHRRVLAERKRLLGPMAKETRESRAEIRRIEEGAKR